MSNRRRLRGPRGRDWEPVGRGVDTIVRGRESEVLAGINAVMPGYMDQLTAAARENCSNVRKMADAFKAQHPGRHAETTEDAVPEHIRHQVHGLNIRVLTEIETGARRHCGHIDLRRPRPMVAEVYSDRAWCFPCFASGKGGRVELSEREEHTCDLCGRYRPAQTMHPMYPNVGPMMLIMGLCADCMRQIHPDKAQVITP